MMAEDDPKRDEDIKKLIDSVPLHGPSRILSDAECLARACAMGGWSLLDDAEKAAAITRAQTEIAKAPREQTVLPISAIREAAEGPCRHGRCVDWGPKRVNGYYLCSVHADMPVQDLTPTPSQGGGVPTVFADGVSISGAARVVAAKMLRVALELIKDPPEASRLPDILKALECAKEALDVDERARSR